VWDCDPVVLVGLVGVRRGHPRLCCKCEFSHTVRNHLRWVAALEGKLRLFGVCIRIVGGGLVGLRVRLRNFLLFHFIDVVLLGALSVELVLVIVDHIQVGFGALVALFALALLIFHIAKDLWLADPLYLVLWRALVKGSVFLDGRAPWDLRLVALAPFMLLVLQALHVVGLHGLLDVVPAPHIEAIVLIHPRIPLQPFALEVAHSLSILFLLAGEETVEEVLAEVVRLDRLVLLCPALYLTSLRHLLLQQLLVLFVLHCVLLEQLAQVVHLVLTLPFLLFEVRRLRPVPLQLHPLLLHLLLRHHLYHFVLISGFIVGARKLEGREPLREMLLL